MDSVLFRYVPSDESDDTDDSNSDNQAEGERMDKK